MYCVSCRYEGKLAPVVKGRPACRLCVARAALKGSGSHGLPWYVRVFGRAVIVPSGCWEYSSSCSPIGYGTMVMVDGRRKTPHRWVLEAEGPPPPGHESDHICHNRPCVRPDHLRWLTHQQNCRNRRIPCMTDEQRRRKYNAYHRRYQIKHRDRLNTARREARAAQREARLALFLAKHAS